MIYLDNSATTQTMTDAATAAYKYMTDLYFNPASAYSPSVSVERDVNSARARLASCLGADADEIIFTSGGTESNNMAINGTLRGHDRKDAHAVCSIVEHPSIYEVMKARQLSGLPVSYVGVDSVGRVDEGSLESVLRPDTGLVSIMHVNNETGAINDIAALSRIIHAQSPNAIFHVDGVQGFCKLPFAPLACDMYSISAHKFHAPKGVGALYVRRGVKFYGGQIGGGQEHDLRSGTTNAPGIMGMDAALKVYIANQQHMIENMYSCKLHLAKALTSLPDVLVNGPAPAVGAPHILNVSVLGVRGEVLLHALEEKETYISTGSACSAHKKGKNRVLEAMGVTGERQEGAIRISLCPYNTIEEMDTAAQQIDELAARLRRFKRR